MSVQRETEINVGGTAVKLEIVRSFDTIQCTDCCSGTPVSVVVHKNGIGFFVFGTDSPSWSREV